MDLCGPANSYLVPAIRPKPTDTGRHDGPQRWKISHPPLHANIDPVNAEACITLEGGDVLSPKH